MAEPIAQLIDTDGVAYGITERCVVGRSDDCDIQLVSEKVSRHHARFSTDVSGTCVEDLGSSNGTRVNGALITQRTVLSDGDQVTIDQFTFTVTLPATEDVTVRDAVPAADADVAGAGAIDIPAPAQSGADRPGSDNQVAANAAANALPGSWVEGKASDSTQFFSPDKLASMAPATVCRHGDLPQLIVLGPDGAAREVIELEVGRSDSDDVWEIGRQSDCDVVLDDGTVSARHAQLVHRGGRWRMVNLVSANGIVVNGERRLSVYLDDGDVVELGGSRLMFFAAQGAAAASSASSGRNHGKAPGSARRYWLLAAALAVLAGVAAAAFMIVGS
jgi:pSer/pThr/pTyr-binding forkhead associated (FHA) protein